MLAQAINYMYFQQKFINWNAEFPDKLGFISRLTFRTRKEADIVCGFAKQIPPIMDVLLFENQNRQAVKLYACNTLSNDISIIDTTTNTVR